MHITSFALCVAIVAVCLSGAMRSLKANPTIDRLAASTSTETTTSLRSLLTIATDAPTKAPTRNPISAAQRIEEWRSYPNVRITKAIEGFYSRMTSSYKSTLSKYDSIESVYGLRAAQMYFCHNIISVANDCPADTVSFMVERMRQHQENASKYTFEYPTGLNVRVDMIWYLVVGKNPNVATEVELTYADEVSGCVTTKTQYDIFIFNKDWFAMTCSTVPSWDTHTEECAIFDYFQPHMEDYSSDEYDIVC